MINIDMFRYNDYHTHSIIWCISGASTITDARQYRPSVNNHEHQQDLDDFGSKNISTGSNNSF